MSAADRRRGRRAMKIVTQNLLAIVPLFLFVAIVGGGLMFTAERTELRWGLEEEANSLAVALAEFVGADRATALLAVSGDEVPALTELEAPLLRVLRWKQARRVALYSADGTRSAFSAMLSEPAEGEEGDPTLAVSRQADGWPARPFETYAGLGAEMDADRFFVGPIEPASAGGEVMRGWAPILDGQGKRVGLLAVEIDASPFSAGMRRVTLRIVLVTLVLLVIGVGVAIALSRRAAGEIRALSRAASDVEAGNLDRELGSGRIQEVADLTNTFGTMREVLKDVLAKTRRALVEGDRIRTSVDLSREFVRSFEPQLDLPAAGCVVAARHLGSRPSGSFYGAIERHKTLLAFVGMVREGEGLEAVLAASTARSLARDLLGRLSVPEALAELVRLAPVRSVECLEVREGTSTAKRWVVARHGEAPVANEIPLAAGAPAVCHTLGTAAQEAIAQYATLFGQLPPRELLDDVARAVPDGTGGCLLVVARG